MTTEVIKRKGNNYHGNDDFELGIHDSEVLNAEARFAQVLVERWGMVTADRDGEEDSAGRSVLKAAEVDDVVERACDMSELFYRRVREKGWVIEIGSAEDIKAELYPNN